MYSLMVTSASGSDMEKNVPVDADIAFALGKGDDRLELHRQVGEHDLHRIQRQDAAPALLREMRLGAAQAQIHFLAVVADLALRMVPSPA